MNASDIFFPKSTFNDLVTPERRSVTNAKYAEVLWRYGDLFPQGMTLGNSLTTAFRDYSVPIYDAAEANDEIRVFQLAAYQSKYTISTTGVKTGDPIPFNFNWKAGTGNDRLMIIANYQTGLVYEIGGLTFDQPYNVFDSPWGWLGWWAMGPNGKAGYQWGNPRHAGVYGVNKYNNLWTGSDRDPMNKLIVGRGCGLPKAAMVVRAERVKAAIDAGEPDIGHALNMSVSITMHDTDATGAGFFLPPATRLEWGPGTAWKTRCPVVPPNALSVPQGLMIVVLPDWDVQAWLDRRGLKGALRRTAEILANTAKRRGIVIGTETGCGASAVIEFDGMMNTKTAATWNSLGVLDNGTPYPSGNLLKDLLERDPTTGKLNFYVVDPVK